MNAIKIKEILSNYDRLEKKADEILDADGIVNDGITSIELDYGGKLVGICYWTRGRGESYIEDITIPVEWFSASHSELEELWQKKHEVDRRAIEQASKAAERKEKRRKAEQKELKKKRELATLKRLKAKYPDV